MTMPAYIRAEKDGVSLQIKLQPRASANEVGSPLGTELRVKVTAPPVDAAANEALVRLIAETLKCPRNRVELTRGHTSRHKTVKIYGMTAEQVMATILAKKQIVVLHWTDLHEVPEALTPLQIIDNGDGSATAIVEIPAAAFNGFFKVCVSNK